MDLHIKFPNAIDVITDEVARFQALSPEEQLRQLAEVFRLYRFLEAHSGSPSSVAACAREEKDRSRKAVEEFIARHG